MPEYHGVHSRKYEEVEATEDAARAIANMNFYLHESEEFDCRNELREKSEKYILRVQEPLWRPKRPSPPHLPAPLPSQKNLPGAPASFRTQS